MASVCLISQNAAGAFRGGHVGHIGGVERQTVLVAQWLADYGHDVSVITWAEFEDQKDEYRNGIKLIRLCEESKGIPIIRFFWPRWWSLVKALRRANADVYIHNAAEAVTGQIALWTKLQCRTFVCSIASEPACERKLPTLNTIWERCFYGIGLRNADAIITQTKAQSLKLETEWGLNSKVLPMPCEPPQDISRDDHVGRSGVVLWVGRVVPLKRLEILLDVALHCPEIGFDVVGELDIKSSYGKELSDRAARLENVSLRGRQPFDAVWKFYMQSSILVCTSEYEGFPNTFLEAMYFGLPIISTFDPDGLLEKEGLGLTVRTTAQLVNSIRLLKEDRFEYNRIKKKSMDYFDEHHVGSKALSRFEQSLASVLGK